MINKVVRVLQAISFWDTSFTIIEGLNMKGYVIQKGWEFVQKLLSMIKEEELIEELRVGFCFYFMNFLIE
jgi:hypothetical protein